MYKKTFVLLGKNVDKANVQAYVTVLKVYQLRTKSLTDEQILDKYDQLIEVIDHQVAKGKEVNTWENIRNKAEDMLSELITVDCNFVRKNLGPKFKANPNNIKMAKRIFGFLLLGKCTDDPLWLETGKKIQQKEPSYGLAKNLGLKCKAKRNKACASKYFNQALGLASSKREKAAMYIQLGHMRAESGAKPKARELYRKAIATDGSKREAHTHIGNLYYGSFAECAAKKDKVKDRLVFIAAYNQYKKSGNKKKMSDAKAQFPSINELFERNYSKKEVMNVNCWIKEPVSLDTRD